MYQDSSNANLGFLGHGSSFFLSKESAFRQHFAVISFSTSLFGRWSCGGPSFSTLPVLAAMLLLVTVSAQAL